jgi:hypothetical protein
MDAQELRNLQEAYMEVYELDEGNKKNKQKKNDAVSKIIQKKLHPSVLPSLTYGRRELKNEQADLYDIILSHLLDEGYAETVESAEAIMVNMSEDWRYHILEEVLDEENERGQRRAAARNMIDRHRTMTKGVSPEDRTGPEGYLRHRAKTERPTTLRNTSSAGQRRAAARNTIDRSATMSKGVSPEDRTGPEGYLRHRAKTGG